MTERIYKSEAVFSIRGDIRGSWGKTDRRKQVISNPFACLRKKALHAKRNSHKASGRHMGSLAMLL